MKNTIKTLSIYLPYDLLMCDKENFKQYYPRLIGIRNDESIIVSLPRFPYTYKCEIHDLMPILKPLKDLQRLIESEFYKWHEDKKADEEIINLFCDENVNFDDITEVDVNKLPYECILYMAKNHYDFQDLISKGLAIDINTLNK